MRENERTIFADVDQVFEVVVGLFAPQADLKVRELLVSLQDCVVQSRVGFPTLA